MSESHIDRLNASFDDIVSAACDTQHKTLCVHMWERSKLHRRSEIANKLDVMAGKQGAHYCDEFRAQNADAQHGMMALATTAVSQKNHIRLYPNPDALNTGIILVNPDPVFVYNTDSYTHFMPDGEDELGIFADKDTLEVWLQSSHFELPEPDKSIQQDLANKLAEMQEATPNSANSIDPKDKAQQAKAREAYHLMMQALENCKTKFDHNEVDVNAKLTNVGGILVSHDGDISIDKPWSQRLESHPELVGSLLEVFDQVDMVTEAFQAAGVSKIPTIAIYQPEGQTRFVHFPPTQQNRQLLEAIAKKQGVELTADTLPHEGRG